MRSFCQFSAHATLAMEFARCHRFTRPDNAIRKNTQTDTSEVLRLPRDMTTQVSKVLRLPQNMQLIVWKRRKSIAAATQNDFCHVMKHVWMSQSATPATRNEATRRLKPPKATPFAELAIGMAIRASRGRLRTVANSCGRLRTTRLRNVERTHPQPPDPHSETRTLATHSGKSRWIPKQWPFATIKHLFKIPIFEKTSGLFSDFTQEAHLGGIRGASSAESRGPAGWQTSQGIRRYICGDGPERMLLHFQDAFTRSRSSLDHWSQV